MSAKNVINRIACALLAAALLSGAVLSLRDGKRLEPEDPIAETERAIRAETPEGGGGVQTKETELVLSEAAPQRTAPPEPTPLPSATPEPTAAPEEQKEKDAAGEKNDLDPTTAPDGEDPGSGGEDTGGGGGNDPGNDPSGDGNGDEPLTGPAIVTNLRNGIVSQQELPDGQLRFYAYGAGADDLSVKVYVRRVGSYKNDLLASANDRDYAFQMELGEEYQFTIYLYQPGAETKNTVRYVTYQARRADADEPVIGEFPPYITTNIDHLADGSEIEAENQPLIVTVRSNPDYRVVTADKISVMLNGVTQPKHTGDSSPEYDLYFAPPNVGDYKEYKIEIVAWYGNSSRYWSKTLTYHAVAEGSNTGAVTVILDATTVGMGILDSGTWPITRGDTARDVLLAFLEYYGYDVSCEDGSSFYLRRIARGDMCYGAAVPPELWERILRDEVTLNTAQHDRDSLGEFDYTMGSGWMYCVNGSYPGRAMNSYELKNGDTLCIRFTLAWGKDIGGFDAAGGAYGRLTGYCGTWVNGGFRPLDHVCAETARQEATDGEDGWIEYTCVRCGDVHREVIPATGGPTPELMPSPIPAPTDEPTPTPELMPSPTPEPALETTSTPAPAPEPEEPSPAA